MTEHRSNPAVVFFDDQLKALYKQFDTPSDPLLQDRELGDKFVAAVRAETGTDMERDAILKRLVDLRKKGELPRLRR